MLTRQATKVQAKKMADAEACCDNFIASVNAMDVDKWNCLPTATKARFADAMDLAEIEDIRGVGPFGQALEQPQSPAPSYTTIDYPPSPAPSVRTLDYANVPMLQPQSPLPGTPTRAPCLAPTMPTNDAVRAPSLAPTLLMMDDDEERVPPPTGTHNYDAL